MTTPVLLDPLRHAAGQTGTAAVAVADVVRALLAWPRADPAPAAAVRDQFGDRPTPDPHAATAVLHHCGRGWSG